MCKSLYHWLLISWLVFLPTTSDALTVGAERPDAYLPLLKDKRVGLVVNHSSRAFDQHLVDYLIAQDVKVTAIFAPEHGFRGNRGAGEAIANEHDVKTGLPIHSLYGKTRKPTAAMLANVDTLVFDIQDVGVRFYTYISTMHYVMEAAAENDKSVIVFDRPNPNIAHIDGPLLEPEQQSFVGMHPIPLLHGMTVAELAQMIVGEKWLDTQASITLHTIPILAYSRNTAYNLPIAPSPNLPNAQSIQLYPSLCLFEPTIMSIGRGTDFPFQVLGHDHLQLGSFRFTPQSMPASAPYPKLQGVELTGLDLRNDTRSGLTLDLLLTAYQQAVTSELEFFTSPSFFDKLAGTKALREAIIAGQNETQIKAMWHADLSAFKQQRQPYLIYQEPH
ncbi:DUF1343 domain-containing protein [Alteromonas sp. ASW11-36]|uniref:DUF1343 domain-containing protein n=1 Tax=Alteromonas arenosi TaxID=3055817 RepID=A0ABT7SZA5_9ALTE|nr:DUF1343 domain-containing protein [Alteromonas sp. ASW11-36]MDM7861523.1 DUF1343 domain-containing protein [Alteromonas sp. ASW11-36]